MHMEAKVTPPSGYKPAGSHNSDMSPGKKTKDSKSSQGLNGGSMNEFKTGAPKSSSKVSNCKAANFTTDADMGLKGGGKK